jgi:hypothetical protein
MINMEREEKGLPPIGAVPAPSPPAVESSQNKGMPIREVLSNFTGKTPAQLDAEIKARNEAKLKAHIRKYSGMVEK